MASYTDNVKQGASASYARALASKHNVTLTSGYRSPSHNKKIGGSPTSYHVRGEAYDFAGSKANMDAFARDARKSGMFREVLWQVAGHYDHVHAGGWTNKGGASVPSGTVEQGDKGGIVETIQKLLGGLSIDGIFGEKTENAVEQFQKQQGLSVDGIVGKNTWEELTKGGISVFFS